MELEIHCSNSRILILKRSGSTFLTLFHKYMGFKADYDGTTIAWYSERVRLKYIYYKKCGKITRNSLAPS
jgi:hypothetical protein